MWSIHSSYSGEKGGGLADGGLPALCDDIPTSKLPGSSVILGDKLKVARDEQ